MGNIANALKAEIIYGSSDELSKEVHEFQVAAMQLTGFLDHIREGALVITPADRADIILGTLLSYRSDHYKNIAGIILTSENVLDENIKSLILGLPIIPIAILQVHTNTIDTVNHLNNVPVELHPKDLRKIASALGVVEKAVNFDLIKEKILHSNIDRVTPLMFEHDLIHRAKSAIKHIVLPEGEDERILKACEILTLRRAVKITLLGDKKKILHKIKSLSLALQNVAIIEPISCSYLDEFAQTYFELRSHKGISEQMARDTMLDVSYFATMMVHLGYADGMVSGAVHTTAHTVRPAFEIIKTQPHTEVVSSVFFMCLSDKVLVYGDCAINPNPNAEQLASIAISSAQTAEIFNISAKVAMLSYSTGTSGTGEMVNKVAQATKIAKELAPDLILDGPMQYDAAIDKNVAQKKMPDSNVAGQASVFIFPDLNTGNNTYKAVQRSAGAIAIGPILQGLNRPVNDLSRGCLVADIVNTIAITAIQAQLNS